MKTYRCTLVTACMLATMPWSVTVRADNVAFPNADGSGQILSDAAWGGTVPETARPEFNVAHGRDSIYHVDRNGTLNGMYFDAINTVNGISAWGNISYTFQFQNNAVLTLTDSISGYRNWGKPEGWASICFKDGFIDFQNKNLWSGRDVYWLRILFAGCTVTNVNNMWILNQATHGHLMISNSAVWVDNCLMPTYTAGLADDRIFINGGSKVSAGQFTMSRSYSGGPDEKHTDGLPLVDVSGTGTEVVFRGAAPSPYTERWDGYDEEVANGHSLFATVGSGQIFRIGDGAKVTVAKGHAIIGTGKGCNNRVIVEGEGSELTVGNFAFAWRGDTENGATNNYIIVRSGGKLTAGASRYYSNGGFNNGIICSNGVVSVYGPKADTPNAKNRITYRMQGDNPSVTFSKDEINEGAVLTYGMHLVFDLPAGGYRDGCVPFRFAATQFLPSDADSALLTCEINGLAGVCRDMRAKREYVRDIVLVDGGSFAFWGNYSKGKYTEAVARWSVELQKSVPAGFKAEVTNTEGTKVTLAVKRIVGSVFLVR